MSHAVLGVSPASAVILPLSTNPESLQLHSPGGFVADIEMHHQTSLQKWACCPAAGSPVCRQPPAVISINISRSCREQPFPRWCPSWGSPRLVTERGKACSFWLMLDTLMEIVSSELPAKLDSVYQACITVWFPPLPSASSPTLWWVLIPNKHLEPKTWPQCLLLENPICDCQESLRW